MDEDSRLAVDVGYEDHRAMSPNSVCANDKKIDGSTQNLPSTNPTMSSTPLHEDTRQLDRLTIRE